MEIRDDLEVEVGRGTLRVSGRCILLGERLRFPGLACNAHLPKHMTLVSRGGDRVRRIANTATACPSCVTLDATVASLWSASLRLRSRLVFSCFVDSSLGAGNSDDDTDSTPEAVGSFLILSAGLLDSTSVVGLSSSLKVGTSEEGSRTPLGDCFDGPATEPYRSDPA